MFLQPFLFLKLSFVDRLGELKHPMLRNQSFPDGTRWCPSERFIANLLYIIPISLWFLAGISIYIYILYTIPMVYKPMYNWGGTTL